jgi:hypothetical protein
MSVPRINYLVPGFPDPVGVRAAAVRMGLIIAAETKGDTLTEDDTKMVTGAVGFLADEYERLAGANDELVKVNAELEARLLEIARLAHTETDGG